MKKLFLTLISLVTFLSISSFSAETNVSDSKKIKVAMSVWQGWYVVNVADKKGFWKKEGLDVEVLNFDNCYNMMADMKSNDVDIGVDMIGTWYSNILLSKEDIYIIGAIDDSYGGDMIVSRDKTLKKGSEIYVYSDMLPTMYFLDKFLFTQGMDINDFKVKRYDSEYIKKAFYSGKVDTILNYGDNAQDSLINGGKKLSDTSEFKSVMPEGMCIFSKSYDRIGSENLKKFWRGYCRAVEWSAKQENKKELYNIIKIYTLKDKTLKDSVIENYLTQVDVYTNKNIKYRNEKKLKEYGEELKMFCEKYKINDKNLDLTERFKLKEIIEASSRR